MATVLYRAFKRRNGFIELNRSHPNRYHEDAVWFCYSSLTKRNSRIHGPLAEVLEKYPKVFKLMLIAAPTVKGGVK